MPAMFPVPMPTCFIDHIPDPRAVNVSFRMVTSPRVQSRQNGLDKAKTKLSVMSYQNRSPLRLRFNVSYGYGVNISLDFAVRQIVPKTVRVTYAAGVDQSARVGWQGGREWNKVLATTVAEIGDRIDVGHDSVTILKR